MPRQSLSTALLGFVFFPALSQAGELQSYSLANDLGTVLASEQFCELTFKQDAISAFIEQRVEANDISFPSTLRTMIMGAQFSMPEMSASARTAHCTQIRRIAISYGFTQE